MKTRALIRMILCFLLFIPLIMADFNVIFTVENQKALILFHFGLALISILSVIRYIRICKEEGNKNEKRS